MAELRFEEAPREMEISYYVSAVMLVGSLIRNKIENIAE